MIACVSSGRAASLAWYLRRIYVRTEASFHAGIEVRRKGAMSYQRHISYCRQFTSAL